MKMNEVMDKTNLSKQTIIYYEKEGLIEASRGENNYRDYSEKDVQTLLWIKCMRAMQVSIEDIRRIQNDEYSMEECLGKQSQMLEEQLQTLQQTQQKIKEFKEKDMPIIPELLTLEFALNKGISGFKKTVNNVSIGSPLTKSAAQRKVLCWVFYATLMALAIKIGWVKWASHWFELPNIFVMVIILVMFFAVTFGLGLGDFAILYPYPRKHNPLLFMMFTQDGVTYCDADSFKKRINHLIQVLQGKQHLKHVTYEDIQSCKVVCHQMMAYSYGTMTSGQLGYYYDFYFKFEDGTSFDLIRPVILDNETEAIKVILENKVKNYEYVLKIH